MKGKMKQRVMAVLLTLVMAVSLLPVDLLGGGAIEVKAAEAKVLNADEYETTSSDLTADTVYGDFTLMCNSSKKIAIKPITTYNASITNTTDKTFTNCVRLGGGAVAVNNGHVVNAIKFTADNPATVTAYCSLKTVSTEGTGSLVVYKASDDDTSLGDVVYTSSTFDWSTINKFEFELEEAGSYYIGFSSKGGIIPYLEVDDAPAVVQKELNADEYETTSSDLTADTVYGDFTLMCNSSKKIAIKPITTYNASITNTTDKQFTNCVRLGGGAVAVNNGHVVNAIKFTTANAATVTAYCSLKTVSTEGTGSLVVYKASDDDASLGDVVYTSSTFDYSTINKFTFNLDEAGSYYIGFSSKGGIIPYILIEEAASSAVGTMPEISTATAALDSESGNIVVTWDTSVAGDGDGKVKVEVSVDGGAYEAVKTLKFDDAKTVTYEPESTGSYKFKVYGVLGSSSNAGVETSTIDFVLPLAAPSVTLTPADSKITVSWGAIDEADSYDVYVYENGTTPSAVTANVTETSYEATGLSNGKLYDVKVVVKRGSETKESEVVSTRPYKAADASAALPGATIYNQNADVAAIVLREKGDITLVQPGSQGLKSSETKDSSFIQFPATTKNYTIKATVEITSATSGTSNGIFMGSFVDTSAPTSMIATLALRGDGSIKSYRSKADGSRGGGDLDNKVKWAANTVYTIEFTRNGATNELKLYDASGKLLDSKSATDHNAAVGDGASVMPAILFSGVTVNLSNILYTEDGTVVFDSTKLDGSFSPFSPGWEYAADPVVKNVVVDNTTGKITATVDGEIGVTGAAAIEVNLVDKDGNVVDTVVKNEFSTTTREVEFTPTASGDYTIVAIGTRPNETLTHESEAVAANGFILPMAKAVVASVTNKGNGSVQVKWHEVPEATSYEVYQDGTLVATVTGLNTMVKGLTIGNKYSFTVRALSDKTAAGAMSDAVEVTVVAEEQAEWLFSVYGGGSISTDTKNSGYEGNANDGQVSVWNLNGKGKIVPNSVDQVAFYYTTVPVDTNFTLKAKVHVDQWTLSNGQEGFGLMAADIVGEHGDDTTLWNNSYMALGSKVEYYWDAEKQDVGLTGTKYSMKLGLGLLAKTGVTKDDDIKAAEVPAGFENVTTTLDTTAANMELPAGTYNIIGNGTTAVEGEIAAMTDFVLEIQKNNTGYFVTYYDEAGNVVKKIKNYDPNALSMIDEDNVYVGFFASRNAKITVSDISFTTIAAKDDAPAEERPITYVEPLFQVQSGTVANSSNYELAMYSNVAGTARIRVNGTWVAENVAIEAEKRTDYMLTLDKSTNDIKVEFLPDATQDLGEFTQLANTDEIEVKFKVKIEDDFDDLKELYVSPDGKSSGKGTKDKPLDVYTAVSVVKPGQTIIVMEGEYLLEKTIKIERGMDGTAEANIRMVADPAAMSRPVFNFQGICPGMVMAGDYWYFYGFDVTRSQNAQKGIQVSGNNNTLDNIMAYYNGNTGIQISRLLGTDEFEDWPANNLILNCTSYGNADRGYEDADGFAAKLTVGEGNVFDGCIAYNNADDGWDLYAKVETGPIGMVTIKNSVAYANGYLQDGTDAGNGNGFKMGGESISGYHTLINSYAFFNKAKGIDSNSCPDIQVKNSISYNNESYNVAFYTNNAKNTDFSAEGVISFKDTTPQNLFPGYSVNGTDVAEQFKVKGSQDDAKINNSSNYYWDGSKSVNTEGTQVTADWFKTLVFTGVSRNADGTINMNGFLELTDAAPAGVGAVPGGTPSGTELTEKIKVTVVPTIPESVLTDEVKKETGCDTVEELVLYLKTQITENKAARKILSDIEGSVVFEVQVLVSIDGINWVPATVDNFPAKGLDVYLPYPEGTDRKSHEFVVSHLITMNCNGQKAGTLEFLKPKETSNGLRVHVMSASPFTIGWAEEIAEDDADTTAVGNASASTGDTTPLVPMVIVMFASAAVCVATVFKKRKNA